MIAETGLIPLCCSLQLSVATLSVATLQLMQQAHVTDSLQLK